MSNLKKFTNGLVSFLKYVINPIVGEDNKLSGKRILGSLLILSGIYLGYYGVKYRFDHLDPVTMLVGVFFGAGLAFWGITTWSTLKTMQSNKSDNENN